MERKGVSYDVGRVMGINWRPDYNPETVRRELNIIKNDLHCKRHITSIGLTAT